MYSPGDGQSRKMPMPGECSHTAASRSGCGYGKGCNRSASITLKMAVLAPMPIASESTMATLEPKFLRIIRRAYWRSCQRVCMGTPEHADYTPLRGLDVRQGIWSGQAAESAFST